VKLLEVDKMGRLNLSYIDAIDPDGAPAEDQQRDSRRDNRRDSRPPRRY
jgi:polyribonucleotide nucleotidyltransferase